MESYLRIAGIIEESIVDGPGIRLVVFGQGCPHHCPGCHNPDTHSFEGGNLFPIAKILQMLDSNPLLDGITLSGGEPFSQAAGFAQLAQAAQEKGLQVMTYTGYTYEELLTSIGEKSDWALLLQHSDLLVDGPFELAKRNLLLRFRGSENQRIINVPESLKQGKVILSDI
jgi:anaerobic ribonucleoside-triphosphate reductase activating protein